MIKFGLFLLLYSYTKMARILAAATVLLAAALAVCKAAGPNYWRLNLAMFSIVPLACLTGYSRIFFTGRMSLLTNWVYQTATPGLAVCYFGAAGIMAARFLYRQRCLRRKLRSMQQWEAGGSLAGLLMGRWISIRVYLADECCSPFAGGILRPYIVIPKDLKAELTRGELAAVLTHEALHIRQGHVALLYLFTWLKILWWIHPLVYVADRRLRENMEYSSDEGSVAVCGIPACDYAAVLLKVLQMKRLACPVREGLLTFFDSHFTAFKRRLQRLEKLAYEGGTRQEYRHKMHMLAAGTAAVLLAGILLTAATSMPRYTKIKEISVFDKNMHPLTYDLGREGYDARTEDGMFYMGRQEMQRFAREHQVQGDYVVVGYDTIMKVPGFGGFGQAALVQVADASDVVLLGRISWIDRLQIFLLKYLV